MTRLAIVAAALLMSAGTSAAMPIATESPLDALRASLSQYRIEKWETEQGLPLNTVQTVLQARSGHLWVGTAAGLARFDGIRFKTFEGNPVKELTSQSIFGLMEDSKGRIWIGHSRGAAVYQNGRFQTMLGPDVTNGRRVWSFAEDRQGAIWAGTESGLVRWDEGKVKVFGREEGLPSLRIRSLAFDNRGTLWIAMTAGGLASFANDRFRVFTAADGLPSLEVRCVLADPGGGVWASTAGGGLVRVDGEKLRTYRVSDGLPTDQLTSLSLDHEGSLWIGTWGSGVCRLRRGEFRCLSSGAGLAGDQIWAVHADREDAIWVGTWVGGLNRLGRRAFVALGTPEGLASDNVRSVMHARDGSTWISMAGGGVQRLEGSKITRIGRAQGLPTDEVASLFEARDGAIWIGTYTSGAARLLNGHIEMFGAREGLPSLDIRAFEQDETGTVWAATMAGVATFDGKRFNAVREKNAPQESVTSLKRTRDGTMWIGTTGRGLIRHRASVFDVLTRKDGLLSDWIMSMHEDANGSLWIGTNGEGMNRIKDGRIASIRAADGLWDPVVQTLLEDRAGNFWITCNRGFYRVSRSELEAFLDGRAQGVTSHSYGPGDALRSTSFAGGHQPAGAIDERGLIWLPSFKGVVIVDPAKLPGQGKPPAVSIDEVTVDGVAAPSTASVELPPGSAPLSIYYSVATLANAERVRFRYRLEGVTRDWVDAGRSREASFPGLRYGSYRFRVQGSPDGQRWSESSKPIDIKVLPLFYETRWFAALAVIAAIAAVAGLIWRRTHQLQKQHEQMERLVAEKTEELRLANEHLSRLSFMDALTGLPNRRRFDEALDNEWRRAERTQIPLAIVMADIDAFKDYNDTLGHPQGDRCLAEVAEVIRQSVSRAGDLPARYGGEEFVILIPAADRAAAAIFAERLRMACESRAIPHPASPVGPVVTISLGVASCIPSPELSAAGLVAEADAALYRAKEEGRNRVK